MSINFDLLGECFLKAGRAKDGVLYLAAAAGLGHYQYKSRVKLAETLYGMGSQFTHTPCGNSRRR